MVCSLLPEMLLALIQWHENFLPEPHLMFNSNCHNYNSIFVLLHLILSFSIFQVVNSFCDCGYRGLRHPNTFLAVCLFFICSSNTLVSLVFKINSNPRNSVLNFWYMVKFLYLDGFFWSIFVYIYRGQVNLTWLSALITYETKRFLEM